MCLPGQNNYFVAVNSGVSLFGIAGRSARQQSGRHGIKRNAKKPFLRTKVSMDSLTIYLVFTVARKKAEKRVLGRGGGMKLALETKI